MKGKDRADRENERDGGRWREVDRGERASVKEREKRYLESLRDREQEPTIVTLSVCSDHLQRCDECRRVECVPRLPV